MHAPLYIVTGWAGCTMQQPLALAGLGLLDLGLEQSPAAHAMPCPAVQLKPWKLETNDTQLLDMMPFLEMVVRTGVPDVRDVVRSYDGEDIPTAFRCARLRGLACCGREASRGARRE